MAGHIPAYPIPLTDIPAGQVSLPEPVHLATPRDTGKVTIGAAPHDVESQRLPGPPGVGSVALRNKLVAMLKGASAGGIPAAALNVAATAVGTAVLEGASHVGPAVMASGTTAGVLFAADVALGIAGTAFSHYSGLDTKVFYKDNTPEEMLERKTAVSGVLNAGAGGVVSGLLTAQVGNVITHQSISEVSVSHDYANQLLGTGLVHGAFAVAGAGAYLYKNSVKKDKTENE